MELDFSSPPLAAQRRPQSLEDLLGQEHLLGPGRPLRRMLEQKNLVSSLILWGPPGCGKTSLAQLIARRLGQPWEALSAVESGVKELRALAERARGQRLIVFIDEIHRSSKTQQDALLPHLESGRLQLIGATTESPQGTLTPALLSRCQVYSLKPLNREALLTLLRRSPPAQYCQAGVLETLADFAQGDARQALGWLEQACLSCPLDEQGRPNLQAAWLEANFEQLPARYQPADHQACTSALIKSIRGSDPHASLYWLGRMVAGGESVAYLARRLRISASEDIGLADPQAIIHTQACCDSAEAVGYPEARYALAQATLYLSLAPKSNSLQGYFQAEDCARQHQMLEVPAWLTLGGPYQNPHEQPLHFRRVNHLPPALGPKKFYQPGHLGYEIKLNQRLQQLWET